MTAALMRQEMAQQPDVLAALLDTFDAIVTRVRAVLPRHLAGTQFIGRGSSDNAALLGRYLAEIGSGRPSGLGALSVHTRYAADINYQGYLVACFSQSGETPEVVAAAHRIRAAGARIVAVTNDAESSLSAAADVTITLGAGAEHAVPATKTVTAQFLAAAVIAAALGAPITGASLASLPILASDALADPGPARLAERWAATSTLLALGRGSALAAAAETALKVRETAAVFAQGMSPADLLHGPIASVGPEAPTIVIGGRASDRDTPDVVHRLVTAGADVEVWPAVTTSTSLDGDICSAITTVIKGQVLALNWALAAGKDPDHPIGLQKITLTT